MVESRFKSNSCFAIICRWSLFSSKRIPNHSRRLSFIAPAARGSSGFADRVGAMIAIVPTIAQVRRSKSAVVRISEPIQRPKLAARAKRSDRPHTSPRKKVGLRSTDLSPKIESPQANDSDVTKTNDIRCSFCLRRVRVIAHLGRRGSLSLRRIESGGCEYRDPGRDLGVILQ